MKCHIFHIKLYSFLFFLNFKILFCLSFGSQYTKNFWVPDTKLDQLFGILTNNDSFHQILMNMQSICTIHNVFNNKGNTKCFEWDFWFYFYCINNLILLYYTCFWKIVIFKNNFSTLYMICTSYFWVQIWIIIIFFLNNLGQTFFSLGWERQFIF